MARAQKKEVKFTNLDKLFFPQTGFTKGQMIQYYLDVAPFILPHLNQRPVTLIRYPDGVTGETFYGKNVPKFAPPWIQVHAVNRRHHPGDTRYLLINDAETLAWCANLAALELHPFLHRATKRDQPTHVVFDLDPGEGADLVTCARVSLLVKEITDGLGLQAFAKVSGSKGVQVYVPLNTPTTYAATGSFAKATAELLQKTHPELVVSTMAKHQRRKRVLIDWSQNNGSKTTVSVYSLRGKSAEPFVSMPVTWDELKRLKRPETLVFTPDAALKRLKKRGDLFEPVLTLKQKLPKAFSASTPAEPLKAYEAKRDFLKTKEPKTGPAKRRPKANEAGNRFVIQKHAASHLHYDFRLEMDGALKSWAIPKGVPTELGVKRSAFAVEDHPLDYLRFEGTIPKGHYGGGTVMVWDMGTYELLGGDYKDATLKLRLAGKKLKGEWHLFKIRSNEGKDVWLIAKSGQASKPISERQDDSSALTRRSMARIAKDNDALRQPPR